MYVFVQNFVKNIGTISVDHPPMCRAETLYEKAASTLPLEFLFGLLIS